MRCRPSAGGVVARFVKSAVDPGANRPLLEGSFRSRVHAPTPGALWLAVAVTYLLLGAAWGVALALQERRRPPRLLLRLTDWRNPILLGLFTALDLILLPLGTANMQVVARRPER